jgi:predicted GNAT family acetyltransferase
VGMIVGTINEHPHFTIEKSVKIDDVWVDNEHRQKGICSQMLSDLLNRFSEQGIEHFTLNYVVNNLEAEQTWRALGFTPIIINSVVKII